ncbi:hypothetical protein FDECE_6169 [Fusarium decemcellulare]|nr:hypothetical protein FDECE_6169 [Fusarium decemcellulare]
MRLLHTTKIEITEFMGAPPPYVILSHRWEEEEVTLHDLQPGGSAARKKGYAKIRRSCSLAASQGFSYIWIDTCCIDKTSSSELSEAINSMFRWYQEAVLCYAFLSDVVPSENEGGLTAMRQMTASKWFTRGWTLQELIAPQSLSFYSKEWIFVASRNDVAKDIESVTGISARTLLGQGLAGISVHQRMQWAAKRTTTRPEDIAYCLLGIFDVNMPLLYGEGKRKAFQRLQEEIVRTSTDLSLFLWTVPQGPDEKPDLEFRGLLAEDPTWFTASDFPFANNLSIASLQDTAMSITNKGIGVEWTVTWCNNDLDLYVAPLAGTGEVMAAIVIQQLDSDATKFCRVLSDRVILFDHEGNVRSERPMAGPVLSWSQFTERKAFHIYRHLDASSIRSSLPAVGFHLHRGLHYEVLDASPAFRHGFGSMGNTWFTCFDFDQDFELFSDTTAAQKIKVVGALALSLTYNTTWRGKKTSDGICCIVVGIERPPPTAAGTRSTFLVPWVTLVYERDSQKAIARVESLVRACAFRRNTRNTADDKNHGCRLEEVSRISGLWYDIKFEIKEQ